MAESDRDAARRSFQLRMSLFYGAIFLVMGLYVPYMAVWLDWRGLTAGEISTIFATPLFARIVFTPSIAFLADRSANHRQVLILLSWGTAASLLVLTQLATYWPILALILLFSLFWTTIMPLTETIAMSGVRGASLDYGRMRLWGSLTFILASFAGGAIIDQFGSQIAVWLIVGAAVLSVFVAHGLPRPHEHASAESVSAAPRISLVSAVALVRAPAFLLFLLVAGTVQASHAVFYAFGTLHWQAQGLSGAVCGILWAVGVIAEICLFAYSGRAVALAGPLLLLLAGGLAGVVRWLAMAFDPPLAMLVLLQVLHGATYGATHLGAIHFISQAVPEAQAGTAQALYAAVTAGIVMGGAMALAGTLYDTFAGGAYAAMALFSAVGIAAVIVMRRTWPGGLIAVRRPG